jgi:hypothetical protein
VTYLEYREEQEWKQGAKAFFDGYQFDNSKSDNWESGYRYAEKHPHDRTITVA